MEGSQKIGVIVFLAIGVVLLGIAGLLARNEYAFQTRAVPVVGSVLSVADARTDKGVLFYRGVIEWPGLDGQKHQMETTSDTLGELQQGATMNLLADPRDPKVARFDSKMGRWPAPAILGAIGAVFSFIALRVARQAMSASKKRSA